MESEGDTLEEDAVDDSKISVEGVIAELPGTEGEETTELTNQSWPGRHFLVDESDDGVQGFQPQLLNWVHLIIYILPWSNNIFYHQIPELTSINQSQISR